jgi:HlyD family secretion protein
VLLDGNPMQPICRFYFGREEREGADAVSLQPAIGIPHLQGDRQGEDRIALKSANQIREYRERFAVLVNHYLNAEKVQLGGSHSQLPGLAESQQTDPEKGEHFSSDSEQHTNLNDRNDSGAANTSIWCFPQVLVLAIEGAEGRREIALENRVYSVGRHETNDICLEDQYISRVHARLVPIPSETAVGYTFVLEDGNPSGGTSRNGTFVNGQLVRSQPLSLSDVVGFGPKVRAVLSAADGSDGPTIDPNGQVTVEPHSHRNHVESGAAPPAPPFNEAPFTAIPPFVANGIGNRADESLVKPLSEAMAASTNGGAAASAGTLAAAAVEMGESVVARPLQRSPRSQNLPMWSSALQTVLDRPPSALPKRLLASGVAFCCLFGTWAWFGQIEEVGRAQGQLVPKGEVYKVQPVVSGTVVNIAVKEGQPVRRGQMLAKLDSRIAAGEVQRLEQGIAAYRQQLEHTQQLIADTSMEMQNRRDIATADVEGQAAAIAQNQAAIASKRNLLDLLQQETAAHVSRLNNLRPLAQEGAIAEEQLFEAQQSVRDRRRALAETQGELQELSTQTWQLQAELNQKQIEVRRSELESQQRLQQLQVDATELKSHIAESTSLLKAAQTKLGQQSLQAPVAGVVSSLNVRNTGEVAQSGQTLAEIAPNNAPLVLVASLPNREAGFVEKGMPVEVKFDAYPYQDFGVIRGTVSAVSADAKGENQKDSVYKIEISLDRSYIVNRGRKVNLKAGQTANAEITIRQRRIADILFDPIKQMQRGGVKL